MGAIWFCRYCIIISRLFQQIFLLFLLQDEKILYTEGRTKGEDWQWRFFGRPGQGTDSRAHCPLLEEQGLRPDHGVQATVSLREDGRILACGGLEGNVIKTVAVDPSCQGAGPGGRF